MANERIIDLNVETSPNDFSTLVGVKDGEVVQIPITSLKHLVGNNLNTLSFYIENAETTPLSVITEAIIDAGYQDKGTCVPVQLNGDWNCFWLCGVYATATAGVYGFMAVDLSDSIKYGLQVDPTKMTLYEFTDHILTEYATTEWVASIRNSLNTRIDNLQNSGGGGASIIYATELPSTPAQAIYVVTQDEVVKVEFTTYGMILPAEQAYCEIVDTLPEVGNGAMDLTTEALYTYYLTTDGELYGYVDAALEAAGGVPVGWYPVALLFGAVGTTYGGKITSTSEVTDASAMYALITTEPKTRVYVPMQDGTFLELTSGIRTRFDEHSRVVSITENARW